MNPNPMAGPAVFASTSIDEPKPLSIAEIASVMRALRSLQSPANADSEQQLAGAVAAIDTHIEARLATLLALNRAQLSELDGLRRRQVAWTLSSAPPECTSDSSSPARSSDPAYRAAVVEQVVQCEVLATDLASMVPSQDSSEHAAVLLATLIELREVANGTKQRPNTMSVLDAKFAARAKVPVAFQNRVHAVLGPLLSISSAGDAVINARRLMRAAVGAARAAGLTAQCVSDATVQAYALPRADLHPAVGDTLIALAGLSLATSLDMEVTGYEQLVRIERAGTPPAYVNLPEDWPIPF